MASGVNKQKARRSSRKVGYYERQRFKTETNKHRRAKKRSNRLDFWRERGVKKNGKKVYVPRTKPVIDPTLLPGGVNSAAAVNDGIKN